MGTKTIKFRPLNFVPILINSKKIQKNVKFDYQVHFNMEIMLNGWIDCLNFENKNMFILQIGPYVHRSLCQYNIQHYGKFENCRSSGPEIFTVFYCSPRFADFQ